MMTVSTAVVRAAFEYLRQGDLDACAEHLTEDFIVNLPGLPGPLHGREIWRAGVQAMRDGFPDLAFTIEDIVADGRIAEEWVSPDMAGLMRQIS